MSPRTLKHGVAVTSERMLDAAGKPITCVTVGNSKPFARACADLMGERDGRDHSWKLALKAFWVPDDIIELARARVEEEARQRAEERI